MSATIVPFNKIKAPQSKKSVKSAEGEELTPPTNEDLVGFINVLNFLALQSSTNAVEISLIVDELNVSIKHHDDLSEGKEVAAATAFEVMASMPYDADAIDKSKTIANLLEIFERLDIDKYEDERTDEQP